jgi:glycosyltransferase involved in cell wall biosynthesis
MSSSLLIDISRLMGRTSRGRLPTGVDRVCLAHVQRFGDRAKAVLRWYDWRRIVPYDASQELFRLLERPGPHFYRDCAKVIARFSIPPWEPQDAADGLYLNLGHSGLGDVQLAAWLRRTRQRPVYMVHDLIPLTHPEYCRSDEAHRHLARMDMLLRTAAGVLTNSQATLERLKQLAEELRLPLPPCEVAPLGPAALRCDPAQPPPLARPYFVVLGTIEPRKNHLMLLHLWRELVAELGERTPHLVVIGQRGWKCENVVDLLERCASLQGIVHELPHCSDETLARFLCHARALLFPSFVEGYGMPLAEALLLDAPAIASHLPVFREAAGDVPEYLDPLDGPAWKRAILDYTPPDSARRAAQLARRRTFRLPTWDDHFARVEHLMERLG